MATAVYGGLYAASPNISIIRNQSDVLERRELFRVDLWEDTANQGLEQPDEVRADGLVSRPESIQDLLNQDTPDPIELEPELTDPLDVAELLDRTAEKDLERKYDLEPESDQLSAVDEKIVEISADTARNSVEVARRFVRPSPNRILEEGAAPVLRGLGDGGGATDVLSIPSVSAPGPEDEPQEPLLPPSFEMLDPAPWVFDSAPMEEGLPPLPPELELGRASIADEIRMATPYEFIDNLVRISIETYRAPDEALGYFRVRISPGLERELEVLPKDVTFVVDASKSILQAKLNDTVRGILSIIERLRESDRFNVVVFRDTPRVLAETTMPATAENKAAARAFLSDLEARGETNVYEAIRTAIASRSRSGAPEIIVVATDGRPTAGVRDARDIINALTEENEDGVSVLAYGSGRTANRYLLDLLAYRNKGESFVSERYNDAPADLPRFFSRVDEPLLTNLEADFGVTNGPEVYPRDLPDFYSGRNITVYGRFVPSEDREFTMRLVGSAMDTRKELVFKANLADAAEGDETIARGWAFQKTYHVIGEICRVGETPELMAELRGLSRKYGIRTSYD